MPHLKKLCYNATLKERIRYGTEDLRRYLGGASMPTISRYDRSHPYCLPLPGKRSHKNKLKVRNNAERRLAKIRRYDPKAFDRAVRAYHKRRVCGRKGRPFAGKGYWRRPGEALVLPSRDFYTEATFENIPYPCSIEETCRWVVERPLRTIQRAVHVAFPDTTRWWMDEATGAGAAAAVPNCDRDRELWRTYLWRFHPDERHKIWWRGTGAGGADAGIEPAPHEAMVVAVQSPWILGPRDLQDVAGCTDMPLYDKDGTPPADRLSARHRVWAKLYDTCRAVDCRMFVLTNYDGWLFGAFSDDWTAVHTSDVKPFDARDPNVVQTLVFWVAASMGLSCAEPQFIPVLVPRESNDTEDEERECEVACGLAALQKRRKK